MPTSGGAVTTNTAQLAQNRPSATTAATALSANNRVIIITSIIICNVSGAGATYRIFHDNDGTTYDQTTALFYDVPIAGGAADVIDFNQPIVFGNRIDNIGVRTSVASALNFTFYGWQLPQ